MDLLISFQWGRFYPMRWESVRIFKKLGDDHPVVLDVGEQGSRNFGGCYELSGRQHGGGGDNRRL